ncbi:MAG: hypothetical protein JRG92_05765 [Deltaproteobacteria bacterium]|jgi:hypothetical protein|nr:hypothetical protein [Deltaproteobacteria bacterium]MBW2383121.1 hypothetical protein [Deltaproteobacteria bacterium]
MSVLLLAACWVMITLGTLLGLRFMRSAMRSRDVLEWLMASFFLGGVTLGFGLLLLVASVPDAPAEIHLLWRTISFGAMQAPAVSIALFTWLVFRPADGWARWLAMALVFTIALHALGVLSPAILGVGTLRQDATMPFYWLGSAVRAACFVWACGESLRYFGLSRRRCALGLVDPLVTNRFLLWAIWSGSATVVLALRVSSRVWIDPASPDPALVQALIISQLVAGVACFGAVWLTFAPPALYRRLVGGPQPA